MATSDNTLFRPAPKLPGRPPSASFADDGAMPMPPQIDPRYFALANLGIAGAEKSWLKTALGVVLGTLVLSFAAQKLGLTAEALERFDVGYLAMALALVWIPFLYKALFRSPVHLAIRVLFLLELIVEGPMSHPGLAYWDSPLKPAGHYLFDPLWTVVPLPRGLVPLPPIYFLLTALVIRARNQRAKSALAPGFVRASKSAYRALGLNFGAALAMIVLGIVVPGWSAVGTYQQLLSPLLFVLTGYLLLEGLRGPADYKPMRDVVVVAAVFKSLVCMFVYLVYCRPTGVRPEYCTIHEDSFLFALALCFLGLDVLEKEKKRRGKTWLVSLSLAAPIVVASAMNNRRIVYVEIAAAAAIIFFAIPWGKLKKRLILLAAIAVPMLAIYIDMGRHSRAAFFEPAVRMAAVIDQKDNSSRSRDYENVNLVETLRDHPAIGWGMGHEYFWKVQGDDLSAAADNQGHTANQAFRFIPHNGVLWLFSMGGFAGFVALWMIFPTTIFLAAFGYRRARSPTERMTGLVALGAVAICMVHAFGDMGLATPHHTLLMALALAFGGKLTSLAEQRAAAQRALAPPQILIPAIATSGTGDAAGDTATPWSRGLS